MATEEACKRLKINPDVEEHETSIKGNKPTHRADGIMFGKSHLQIRGGEEGGRTASVVLPDVLLQNNHNNQLE